MGKKSIQKGKRNERNVVNKFKENGIVSIRIPLSGATEYKKGDVVVTIGGKAYVGEVKVRQNGFATLYKWLEKDGAELLFLKRDRSDFLVCMRLDDFIDFAKKIQACMANT
jgi:Holliday junction resolvase